jgi:hypothetical protein
MHLAHTASAAAGDGFQHDRAALSQAAEKLLRFLESCGADRSRQHRCAGTLGQGARLHFIAE